MPEGAPHVPPALDWVFQAGSVAVAGASEAAGSLGAMVYGNLRRDFPGPVYAVNSRHPLVMGDPAYPDVRALPEAVDLVVLLVPARDVADTIRDCIERGHRSVCILSAGFSEAGSAGAELQQELSHLAVDTGLPIIGPNCIGIMNLHHRVMANFALPPDGDRPAAGPVGIVSQSGGFGSYILNRSVMSGVRVGMFASTGNECDVSVADVLAYFINQPEMRVVSVFAEAIRNPAAFLAAAERALELDKVIICVSPGGSEEAARAALSHTATVIGSSQVFSAVCQQFGVLQARTIDQLIDLALMFQDGPRMAGNRIGIFTPSGGAGVLASAHASEAGLQVPELTPQTQERIAAMMPAFASARNPVDTTAGMAAYPPEIHTQILEALLEDDVVDGVVAITWGGDSAIATSIAELYKSSWKPIAPVITARGEALACQGVPVFNDPTRAVEALAAIARLSRRRRELPHMAAGGAVQAQHARTLLAAASGREFVLESTAKDVLASYGLPVAREFVCANEDAAAKAAADLGGPVAMKVLSYGLPHKSDTGALRLNVEGEGDVRACYQELVTTVTESHPGLVIEGILVQEMVPVGLELLLGLQRDAVFGPMLSVGLGGVHVELLACVELLRAPFDFDQALAALHRISGGRLSEGARGISARQMETVARATVSLGALALDLPEVHSIDINPVMVSREDVRAVDALMVIRPAGERVG